MSTPRSTRSTSNIASTANGTRALQASYDALRVLRFGEDYALSDVWLGADRSAVNALSRARVAGHEAPGRDHRRQRRRRRGWASRPDFIKFNFEASRTQTLFVPWEGASVGLMGLLTGQWSGDILPPAEQFYLGGARFTRGYYAGQVPGDKALAATVELQLNTGFETTLFSKSFDIAHPVLPVLRLGRDLAEPERRP